MTLLSFISAFCTFLSVVIGSFTLRENIRSFQNWLFAVFCFSVGYIAFSEFGYRQSESFSSAQFWFRLSLLSPMLIPLMFHFITRFAQIKRTILNTVLIYLNYCIAIFFIIRDFFTGQISGMPGFSVYGWDHNMVTGIWYQICTVWACITYVSVIVISVRHFIRLKQPADKIRAKYTMYAFTIICLFATTTDKLFPFIKFEFPELSTLGFVIANVLIGYAIFKYKLLSISPVTAAENIVETMNDSLFLLDTKCTIVSANTAAERMVESSPRQLVTVQADTLFFDTEARDRFINASENWKKPLTDHSSQFRTFRGNTIPVSVSTSILTNNSGIITGHVLIVRNISERLAAQQALQNANILLEKRVEERTAELIDSNFHLAKERDRRDITLRSIGDGVIVLTTDSEIELMNSRAEEITGCSYVSTRGRNINDIYHVTVSEVDQTRLDPTGDTLKTGKWLEHNACLSIDEHSIRHVEGSTAPIKDESDNIIGCVLVFRDCTEKYAIQQELFKISRLESIGSLAGGIASDFDSILKNITNNMLLIKILANHTPDTVKLINETEQMALNAQMLTKKLMVLSGGNDYNEPEEIESVKDLINSSIGFLIKNDSIDYDIQYDDDLMNVRIDKGNFQAIFSNLINNAQEAINGNGSLSITAKNVFIGTHISQTQSFKRLQLNPGRYVKVTIHDNGPGIKKPIQEKAFDPFFSTKKGNRGLGLSEAYSILKRNGGIIFFEPEITVGCAVSFIIPSTDQSTSDQLAFSKYDLLSEENSQICGKLLLIEQDSAIRNQLSKTLSTAGFDIIVAEDISTGINIFDMSLSSIPFDSIICNIECLNNNAFYQFLSKMRILNQPLKTIGIKTNDSVNYESRIFNTFFSTIVHAPVEMKNLLKAVKSVFSY